MANENDGLTISVGSLGEGAAEELFADAMGQVVKSLSDPNVDAKAKRTITMKYVFQNTDESRRVASVAISSDVKVPGIRPAAAVVYMGRDKGELVAREAPPQRDMFQTPMGKPKAVESEAADG